MSKDDALRHFSLAEEKLAAARGLLASGFERDAASRAYYAMYHAAYALVRTKGHAPKTHRGLAGLIAQEFQGSHGLPLEMITSFRRAQSVRELGDYEASFSPGHEVVEELLREAAVFLERVRKLLG